MFKGQFALCSSLSCNQSFMYYYLELFCHHFCHRLLILILFSKLTLCPLYNCSTPAIVPSTLPKLVVSLIIVWIHSTTPLSPISILLIQGQMVADREKVKKLDPPKTKTKYVWSVFINFYIGPIFGAIRAFLIFLLYFFTKENFFK